MPTICVTRNTKTSFLTVALLAIAAAGCGPKPDVVVPVGGARVEDYDKAVQRIGEDPILFLREVYGNARNLTQFKAHFERQERLGLFRELKPIEAMTAEYRAAPLSVRFTWLDDDSEYRQCYYIEGKNDNHVVLLPRSGVFGLAPSVATYPATWAVLFGRSKFPITDFGPRRLMEKTLKRIKDAEKHGGVVVKLREPAEIGPSKEPCFHVELRYPAGDAFTCKLQDLYIHTKNHLPVATYLWLPGDDERSGETLDAMYLYAELNPDVKLTNADFVIDINRRGSDSQAGVRTAGERGAAAGSPQTALSHHDGQE